MKYRVRFVLALLILAVVFVSPSHSQPLKWQQMPDMVLGDAYSSTTGIPTHSADDWQCLDGKPVTDVHWWGTFWTPPNPPGTTHAVPRGFNIRIYTDVPVNPPGTPFSHPGSILGEWYVTDFHEAVYGVRPAVVMPDGTYPEATVYSYWADLNPWFEQEKNKIYWLEIQADLDYPPNWGWWDSADTFNDDAVFRSGSGQWQELTSYFRGGASTHLAFELTTVPEPSSLLALAGGLGWVGLILRKRR